MGYRLGSGGQLEIGTSIFRDDLRQTVIAGGGATPGMTFTHNVQLYVRVESITCQRGGPPTS